MTLSSAISQTRLSLHPSLWTALIWLGRSNLALKKEAANSTLSQERYGFTSLWLGPTFLSGQWPPVLPISFHDTPSFTQQTSCWRDKHNPALSQCFVSTGCSKDEGGGAGQCTSGLSWVSTSLSPFMSANILSVCYVLVTEHPAKRTGRI